MYAQTDNKPQKTLLNLSHTKSGAEMRACRLMALSPPFSQQSLAG
jgi:hypothetical protein